MFPLYNELLEQMDGSEDLLTKKYCLTITKLSQEHLTIIYLIILHSYLEDHPDSDKFPYDAKTISNGKGVLFKKISQIPDHVQKIIYRYLEIISQ